MPNSSVFFPQIPLFGTGNENRAMLPDQEPHFWGHLGGGNYPKRHKMPQNPIVEGEGGDVGSLMGALRAANCTRKPQMAISAPQNEGCGIEAIPTPRPIGSMGHSHPN